MLRAPPQPDQPITAALFDLDGTLVASEYLNPLAWDEVLRSIGAIGPDDSIQSIVRGPGFLGSSAPAIAKHVIELFGITGHTVDELVTRKRALSVEMAQRPAGEEGAVDLASLWYDGVVGAVRELEGAGVRLALCTSNLRPITAAVLEAAGATELFARRVVQEDVGNSEMKPHPAPYLRGLALVDGSGPSAVAFEDSATGVKSAVSAGIGLVLGVCNNSETDEEAERDAAGLVEAGAGGAFRTTVDAVRWLMATGALGTKASL
eukprot:COSAG04_NODE_2641_length_3819_cov_2.065323_1_plen_263_part_00